MVTAPKMLKNGHIQTFMSGIKEKIHKHFIRDFDYDKRVKFRLADGGQIYIDLKGNCFKKDQTDYNKNISYEHTRPVLFVLPGLTSTSTTNYVVNFIREAYEKREFDIIALNYRGMNGCPLTTPQIHTAALIKDITEPMEYFYNKFCKKQGKKVFALGCSMGANILANVLGS